MEEVMTSLSNLEVRYVNGLLPQSVDRPSTAIFQFVNRNQNKFLIQNNYPIEFKVVYKYQDQFYPHPYTLRTHILRSTDNSSIIEYNQVETYEILLFLELKRLQDFHDDDLKRYYEIIDTNVDNDGEINSDFHDIYLICSYNKNGKNIDHKCNNGQSLHLPKFISNPWTQKNTLTRFRYEAENRDGTFPCEMTLHSVDTLNLQSYKIVLCLISNTIPPKMDYHALRWFCKLKSKSSKKQTEKENSYTLSHPSGMVIAQVFGSNLKFSPHLLQRDNNGNYVRSYVEPKDFQIEFAKSDIKDSCTLTIAVKKGTDYPTYMRNRRNDPSILRYLPFDELGDMNKTLHIPHEKMIKRLKTHKDECTKQLLLSSDKSLGTFSQSHVRLYVAAYNENDVLLTESLYPPLRNNKTFEQLRIIRIVQPRHDLYANESAFVYCDYDYNRSKIEYMTCPYEFQLAFTSPSRKLNENELEKIFHDQSISISAAFVQHCPSLLQFQIPNYPEYHEHKILIRLRHKHSRDYNPSAIALAEEDSWTYHADMTLATDIMVEKEFNKSISESVNKLFNHELQIEPLLDQFNYENHSLNTPDINSTSPRRFSYSD